MTRSSVQKRDDGIDRHQFNQGKRIFSAHDLVDVWMAIIIHRLSTRITLARGLAWKFFHRPRSEDESSFPPLSNWHRMD